MTIFKCRSERWTEFAAILLSLSVQACGNNPRVKGELMLAISTDMSIDNDLDRVDVIVERENGELFNETVDLYPKVGGLFTPGTYAIVAGDKEGEAVRVSLVARKGSQARVVRELRTTIPRERVGLVPMPVQWLCEGEVASDGKSSSCFAESASGKNTCNVGRCADNALREEDIEDFASKTVYGGYDSSLDAARHGACFDVVRCFDASRRVELDLDTCSFARPEGMKTPNVGLVVKEDGHCNPASGQCYIPLDSSKAFGWVANGSSVEVPGGVCDRLRDGRVLAVVTTGACDTKKITTPTCGTWLGPTGSNDRDGDGIADADDNCPDMPNAQQADTDADGIGDACDLAVSEPDEDGDSITDADDNCPTLANTDQVDTEKDGLGDSCDSDDDDDGYLDSDDPAPLNPFEPDQDQDKIRTGTDNCPSVANVDQLDMDKDGQGDACDNDLDGDGVVNKLDNCSKVSNATQDDCDGNGIGTACDQCPSRITITKPLSNVALPSRVFQVAGTVGTLDLSALSIQTQSVATGRQFSQTVPVANGAFSSGNLILNAGQNQVTATACNCQSAPVTVSADVNPADILVTLTWDKPNTDIDLYLYEPAMTTTACYFDAVCAAVSGVTPLGAVLDTDNTSGYGPENYTLSTAAGNTLAPGTYRVRLHYFAGAGPTNYDVRVLLNENSREEAVAHFTGTLTESSRTNNLPNSNGTGWADVAVIVCGASEGLPSRCTVNAATMPYSAPTTGTGGAGGATSSTSQPGSGGGGGGNSWTSNDTVISSGGTANTTQPTGSAGSAGSLNSAGSCEPLCSGLVGWWRFEDDLRSTNSVVLDSSGRDNNGSLVAGKNASIAGKLGMGFLLDATTEIDVPNSSSLNPSSITVMYWLHLTQLPTAARGQAGVMKRSIGGTDCTFQACINGSGDVGSNGITGKPDFSYYNTHWHDRTSVTPIAAGEWYHLAFVFDGNASTAGIFINGASVAATAYINSNSPAVAVEKEDEPLNATFASTLRFNAGSPNYVAETLDGVMDEVRIYDRALTATEIYSYYSTTR